MKHNQYRNKITKTRGSEDMDTNDKNRVKQILMDMGYDRIWYNQMIMVSKDIEKRNWYCTRAVDESELQSFRILARPDIVVAVNLRRVIIEVDGAVHRDWDYDKRYEDYNIPYLKLNKEYLQQENISWEKYIREYLPV